MKNIRRDKRASKGRGRGVRIGSADPTLTGLAGLAAVEEMVRRVGVVGLLDAGIGASGCSPSPAGSSATPAASPFAYPTVTSRYPRP